MPRKVKVKGKGSNQCVFRLLMGGTYSSYWHLKNGRRSWHRIQDYDESYEHQEQVGR